MTMTYVKFWRCVVSATPIMACAHNSEVNQRVPPVGIADRGELTLNKDEFSYKMEWRAAGGKSARPAAHCGSNVSEGKKRHAD